MRKRSNILVDTVTLTGMTVGFVLSLWLCDEIKVSSKGLNISYLGWKTENYRFQILQSWLLNYSSQVSQVFEKKFSYHRSNRSVIWNWLKGRLFIRFGLSLDFLVNVNKANRKMSPLVFIVLFCEAKLLFNNQPLNIFWSPMHDNNNPISSLVYWILQDRLLTLSQWYVILSFLYDLHVWYLVNVE